MLPIPGSSALALVTLALAAGCASGGSDPARSGARPVVRFATFNASLHRATTGALAIDLASPDDAGARAAAAIIRRVDPDVILINEFDHDDAGRAAALFKANYLERVWDEADAPAPVVYPHVFTAPSNTGEDSGLDLDASGRTGEPGDAFGFGRFPGQYGMVVLSKHPIDREAARTFRLFRWIDMPGALLPDWYAPEARAALRLSSKSHWDLPIDVGGRTIHLLASHPTPPVFDGPEDRNGRRNHDEIRFWADYVVPERSAYVVDDAGRRGGLAADAAFVIAGDLNADPHDGDRYDGAIRQLLAHDRIDARTVPTSAGGPVAAAAQGGANADHRGNPAHDTADFRDDPGPGNLRIDYVLPSAGLKITAAGVHWPDPPAATTTHSDHRLVWIDVARE